MLSHIFLSTNDFTAALTLYEPLMEALGLRQRFLDMQRPWAVWENASTGRPFFILGAPYNGEPATPGNGVMVAFAAASRLKVAETYAIALSHGGKGEGAPGLSPEYHPDFYGAYFRDLDGNKLCICCHRPPVGVEDH